jgi:hypothetical protein
MRGKALVVDIGGRWIVMHARVLDRFLACCSESREVVWNGQKGCFELVDRDQHYASLVNDVRWSDVDVPEPAAEVASSLEDIFNATQQRRH